MCSTQTDENDSLELEHFLLVSLVRTQRVVEGTCTVESVRPTMKDVVFEADEHLTLHEDCHHGSIDVL